MFIWCLHEWCLRFEMSCIETRHEDILIVLSVIVVHFDVIVCPTRVVLFESRYGLLVIGQLFVVIL